MADASAAGAHHRTLANRDEAELSRLSTQCGSPSLELGLLERPFVQHFTALSC